MVQVISCCGVICSNCQYYPNDCKGCPEVKGRVFWLEYTGEEICEIYDCCVNRMKFKHCGKCDNLPCDRYNESDPTKTQEENDNDFIGQLTQLKKMK
ncbi:DUF3795 domain-containing protein [Anaerorhabdus sp.]|uniref:DUF3795 domain-containing protein n=1 Tax=Anaerorhabdus sp. TaxID=1872524 RepID=UPI002FCC913B